MVEYRLAASPVRLRIGAIVLLAGVLWAVSGLSGVALAVIVGVAWAVIQTPYAVAIGQLLHAVGDAEAGVLGVVTFGILFVPELLDQWRPNTALLAVAVFVVATAAFAGSVLIESVAIAVLVSGIGFGVAAYSIHRYELVRFGLVEPNP
jgi:hypothetical protein